MSSPQSQAELSTRKQKSFKRLLYGRQRNISDFDLDLIMKKDPAEMNE